MSKNKLAKFADLEQLRNVYQYPYSRLQEEGFFPYKGEWGSKIFGNTHPIVVELGCGRGEYTLGLARRFPECNFIGIDIKGNRMWNGAMKANREGLHNVCFLRTEIEFLNHFFGAGELSEIWLTFPDPQMKKVRKRLTGTRFLKLYNEVLGDEKFVHLKSDSNFLYRYTLAVAEANNIRIVTNFSDIHNQAADGDILREIRTYYEEQWLARGINIKYLKLSLLGAQEDLIEPDVEIEYDDYRSYGRDMRSTLNI